MNTRKIIVDALHLSGLRVWTIVLSVATTYATAELLGQRGFGMLAAFSIVPQLATYGSLGWDQAAMRDLPHLIGAGDLEQAKRTRAVAYTAELLMTALWMAIACVIAVFLQSPIARIGVLLGGASVLIAKLTRLFMIDAFVDKDFRIQARIGMAVAVADAPFQILAAWKYGAVATFGGLVLANLIGLLIYWKARGLRFTFSLEKRELIRLTRVGFPMAFLGLVSGTTGASAYIERALIGGMAGLSVLGLYAFGITLNNYLIAFVGDFSRTYQPHLLEALGRSVDREQIGRWLDKPALGISYAAAMLGTCMLAGLPPLVRVALPDYSPVLPALPILFTAGLISCLTYVPGMFLNSAFANQQVYYTKLWTIATAAFGITLFLLLRAGFGLTGAACAAIVPQLFVVSLAIPKAYSYYLGSLRLAIPHATRMIVPIFFVTGTHLAARFFVARYPGAITGHVIADEFVVAAVTLIVTLVPLGALAWQTFPFRDLMRTDLQTVQP